MTTKIGYLVGTKDVLAVNPPGDRMGFPGDKQPIHDTFAEAVAYRDKVERAFTSSLVIYRGEFMQVEESGTKSVSASSSGKCCNR